MFKDAIILKKEDPNEETIEKGTLALVNLMKQALQIIVEEREEVM